VIPGALEVTGQLALFIGAAGLLALDRRAAFQAMLSQPIVCVPVLGLYVGQLPLSVDLAVRLQLLWMASMLFGASTPPNETAASLVSAGAALTAGRWLPPSVPAELIFTLAILLGAPFAALGRAVDQRLDRGNSRLAAMADAAAAAGDVAALAWVPWRGMARVTLAHAALATVGLLVATPALWALALALHESPVVGAAVMAVGVYVVPALGLAVSLALVRRRRAVLLGVCTFALFALAVRSPGWVPT
jgi:mannose/fructose/N-acetylgalactosamine-specific phosphotransferase system component IIC